MILSGHFRQFRQTVPFRLFGIGSFSRNNCFVKQGNSGNGQVIARNKEIRFASISRNFVKRNFVGNTTPSARIWALKGLIVYTVVMVEQLSPANEPNQTSQQNASQTIVMESL
jgi:hypothetical protein